MIGFGIDDNFADLIVLPLLFGIGVAWTIRARLFFLPTLLEFGERRR